MGALLIVVVATSRAKPGAGLHDASLGVSLALFGFALAVLAGIFMLAGHRTAAWLLVPVLIVLMASSAALVWLQPDGAGGVGLLVAVGIAARIVPGRTSVALLTLCLAFLLVAETASPRVHHQGTWPVLLNALPLAAIYIIVLFGRRIRVQEAQTERLLIELEESRGAELRAAALAERQRLARDMHDVLAHSLSGLLLQLEGARLLALATPADERLAGTIVPPGRHRPPGGAGLQAHWHAGAGRAFGWHSGRRPDRHRLPGPAAGASGRRGMTAVRVLAADDQRVVREGLAMLLGLLPDVEVVGTAADGEEVLALAAELRPDVILMDLRMPRMDGVEATRRLRERDPAVKVVVLTTYADDRSVLDALRAGALGYLTKDAGAAEIQQALHRVAGGQAALDPAVQLHLVEAIADGVPSGPSPASLPDGLTPREAEVLTLIAAGLSNAEIAERLVVSEATVKSHVNHMLAKIGARDRAQAVGYAYRHGLVPR